MTYGPWGTVFNKLGTAFATAYRFHTGALPGLAPESDAPGFVKTWVLPTAVTWLSLGGPQGVVLVPIVNGINLAVAYMSKRPRNVKIQSPGIDLTPEKFAGSLKHVLDTAFRPILSFVSDCIRYADVSESITREATKNIWDMIGLSPTAYLPKDWDKWDVDDTADEFERQLWVRQASMVKTDVVKNHTASALGSYNYKKVIDRLAYLTRKLRDGQSEAFARLAKDYSDQDYHKLNVMMFVQIVKWTDAYKPFLKFDNPLPGAVIREMQKLASMPADVDQLLLGTPLIKARP
jgi:hypothetical protein